MSTSNLKYLGKDSAFIFIYLGIWVLNHIVAWLMDMAVVS